VATRTFLALDLDLPIREQLLRVGAHFADAPARIRWVDLDRLHVTLNFLGDLEDQQVAAVCDEAGRAAGHFDPMALEICGVEPVPDRGRRLRMFWAGVQGDLEPLARLYGRLNEAFGRMHLPVENRKYRPHVTLARVKFCRDAEDLRRAAYGWEETLFGSQSVEAVSVYASTLTRKGAEYRRLAHLPLGDDPGR
jgi:RNA 2',3'-cyclic 3'-phosphodiesterase